MVDRRGAASLAPDRAPQAGRNEVFTQSAAIFAAL